VNYIDKNCDDVDLSGYNVKGGKLIPSSSAGFGMPLIKKIENVETLNIIQTFQRSATFIEEQTKKS